MGGGCSNDSDSSSSGVKNCTVTVNFPDDTSGKLTYDSGTSLTESAFIKAVSGLIPDGYAYAGAYTDTVFTAPVTWPLTINADIAVYVKTETACTVTVYYIIGSSIFSSEKISVASGRTVSEAELEGLLTPPNNYALTYLYSDSGLTTAYKSTAITDVLSVYAKIVPAEITVLDASGNAVATMDAVYDDSDSWAYWVVLDLSAYTGKAVMTVTGYVIPTDETTDYEYTDSQIRLTCDKDDPWGTDDENILLSATDRLGTESSTVSVPLTTLQEGSAAYLLLMNSCYYSTGKGEWPGLPARFVIESVTITEVSVKKIDMTDSLTNGTTFHSIGDWEGFLLLDLTDYIGKAAVTVTGYITGTDSNAEYHQTRGKLFISSSNETQWDGISVSDNVHVIGEESSTVTISLKSFEGEKAYLWIENDAAAFSCDDNGEIWTGLPADITIENVTIYVSE